MSSSLTKIKQGPDEPFSDFIHHFLTAADAAAGRSQGGSQQAGIRPLVKPSGTAGVWSVHSCTQIRRRALLQFCNMIQCTIPGSHPLMDYNDYGCFCGFGGSNTPVDELDGCCQMHDNCYGQAQDLESCRFLDNPYTTSYSYSCSGNEVICSDKNNACEAFICSCDQQAAICFSKSPYNKENKGIHC
ncbi:phospholipase A2, minor isoenzyme-like [Mesocricetus auratus]|uniref:Phospholipase A2 n=1 Tax=Mesocricetus auratus TaxID=10036 RepID=A0ABM2WGM2_MESAU|nr:phospholipase A2, minor isoenzyme-like [Mesocricetus auratus]